MSFAYKHAVGENADPITDFLRLREQMGGEQHSDSTPSKIENQIANFARPCRVDTCGWFVQDDQPGIVNQRLREPDALQHPFRISAQPAFPRLRQSDKVEQFIYAIFQSSAFQPAKSSEKTQRFFPSEIFVKIRILRQKTDCFPAFNQTAIAAENFGAATRWRNKAKNNFESCALPGAIWTEQSVNFPGLHAKIEIAHCDNRLSMERNGKNFRQATNSNSGITHGEFQNRGR